MIVRAEWPGYVMDVLVRRGEEVEEDQSLILLEGTDASHTPFYVSAPEAGKVKDILVEEGDFADEDDELVTLSEFDGEG